MRTLEGILRFIGIVLGVAGVAAIWAAVQPLPGTPIEFSVLTGIVGICLIAAGNSLWRAGGGRPILDVLSS